MYFCYIAIKATTETDTKRKRKYAHVLAFRPCVLSMLVVECVYNFLLMHVCVCMDIDVYLPCAFFFRDFGAIVVADRSLL